MKSLLAFNFVKASVTVSVTLYETARQVFFYIDSHLAAFVKKRIKNAYLLIILSFPFIYGRFKSGLTSNNLPTVHSNFFESY